MKVDATLTWQYRPACLPQTDRQEFRLEMSSHLHTSLPLPALYKVDNKTYQAISPSR